MNPDEFCKKATERGTRITVEQLEELHRRGVLVPIYRLRARAHRLSPSIAIDPSFSTTRYGLGGTLGIILDAAQEGVLDDPATRPFRPWAQGLRTRWNGIETRRPSVFYSPYQLIALRILKAAASQMVGRRGDDNKVTFNLARLHPKEIDALAGGRQMAILLSALDMRYLPRIMLTAHHADLWQSEDPKFDIHERVNQLGTSPEELARVADCLLSQAHFIDPLGDWWDLVRQSHPDTWTDLKGDALLALDYRIAAEILLAAVDDLGRTELSTPPPVTGRMVRAVLDDRLSIPPRTVDEELTRRGLSPHPTVLLVLEGETEMLLMPRVITALYERPVPADVVDYALMGTVDRDLDLLVRHVIGLRLGDSYGDLVRLTRPPTQIIIAVDAEKRFGTKAKQESERAKLVRRLHGALEPQYRTPRSLKELDGFVTIMTWGRYPWEFANFTDHELARAIMHTSALPSGVTSAQVLGRVQQQRHNQHPNVEVVTSPWRLRVNKVRLAEDLWPCLERKVNSRAQAGTLERLPAGRVAVQVVRTVARTHRRNVVLPLK
ncbi:MAG: hypothetical protein ACRDFS_06550 [Chloroflexota bacterium]